MLIHRDAREVRITRGEFQTKFPEYQMPPKITTRIWDGRLHHIFNEMGDQAIGTDISNEKFEEYLNAIPYYLKEQEAARKRQRQAEAPTVPVPGEPNVADTVVNDWGALESAVIGGPVWDKMVLAMGSTTKCNAAVSLILSSFAMKNAYVLTSGFQSLLEAMEAKSAPKFTEEELTYLNASLAAAGFDPELPTN